MEMELILQRKLLAVKIFSPLSRKISTQTNFFGTAASVRRGRECAVVVPGRLVSRQIQMHCEKSSMDKQGLEI